MSRVRCVCRAPEKGATRNKPQLTVDASTRADACMSKCDPNKDLTTRSRAGGSQYGYDHMHLGPRLGDPNTLTGSTNSLLLSSYRRTVIYISPILLLASPIRKGPVVDKFTARSGGTKWGF